MSRNEKDKKRKTYHLDYKDTRKRVESNKYEDLYDNEEKDKNNDDGKGKEILKQYGYDIESNPFNDPSLDKKFVWKAKRENLEKQGMDRKEIDRITDEDKRIKQMEELEKVRDRRNKRDLEKMQWEQERSKNDLDKEGYSYNEWRQKEHEFHLRQASERSLIRMKSGRPKPIDQLYININPDLEVDCEINEPHKNVEGLDLKSLEELLDDLQTYSELDKNQHQDYWNALRVLCNYELDKKRKQQKIKHLGDGIHSSVTDDVANIFEGKPFNELEELEKQIKERVLDPSTPDPEYWNSLLSNVVIYMARAKLSEIHKEFSKKRLIRLESQKQKLLENNNNNNENNENFNNEIIERNVNNNYDYYQNDKIEVRKIDDDLDDWQQKLKRGEINVEEYRKVQLEKEAQRLLERSKQFGGNSSKKSSGDLLREEREKGMNQGEEIFNIEVPLKLTYSWSNKYTPEKAQYFNRVKIGYEWTKYNRTHFDSDNPPPKVVKGYRFNIFYPDLVNTKIAPSYTVTNENDEWSIIRFTAGAPYEDLAFKIVNREWEYSHKRGYKCLFDRGVFHLIFNFRKYRYRR